MNVMARSTEKLLLIKEWAVSPSDTNILGRNSSAFLLLSYQQISKISCSHSYSEDGENKGGQHFSLEYGRQER